MFIHLKSVEIIKTKKQSESRDVKRKLVTDFQDSKEIISWEELKRRGGIIGDKRRLFMAMLQIYHKKNIISNYQDNLTGVAEFLYSCKLLYAKVDSGYKLMTFTSIITYIHRYHKEVEEEIAQEEEEKEKYKSKYKHY